MAFRDYRKGCGFVVFSEFLVTGWRAIKKFGPTLVYGKASDILPDNI